MITIAFDKAASIGCIANLYIGTEFAAAKFTIPTMPLISRTA